MDSLESMKELAISGDWSIRVPTTLVIELEHLVEVYKVARFWTVEEVDLSKVCNICTTNPLHICSVQDLENCEKPMRSSSLQMASPTEIYMRDYYKIFRLTDF